MIERFIPGAGGVENVAWQVAHELQRQGERVTVFTREAASKADVPARKIFAPRFWQPLRIPFFSAGAGRATRAADFDVVHSFSHTRHQDLFRAGGGSHLDYLRRNHEGAARRIRYLSPRHRVRLGIERDVFERSEQRIQCASSLVADVLVSDHGVRRERILMLPNAVEAGTFASPRALEAGRVLRKEIDPEAGIVWLLPGSGWRRKGLATALGALARLDDPSVRLWVAGRDDPAPWRGRVARHGLEARVRFLGERADMPALYQAADGVILPTRYDPFANVTLEAAAAGTPIITTAANGAAEWMRDDAIVIDRPDDEEAFARALTDLASAEARERRGGALAGIAKRLDWPSHVRSLREEYERIVEHRMIGSAN